MFQSQTISTHPHVKQSYLANLKATINTNYSFATSLHNSQITFIVNNKECRCIRPLFAIHSKVLTKILYPDNPNNCKQQINLNHIDLVIDTNSFTIIQKWCYNIGADINLNALLDIISFAMAFDVIKLLLLCRKFIQDMRKTNKKLFKKQSLWLLDKIETSNLFRFIPFSVLCIIVLQNPVCIHQLSPEQLWKVCIKCATNKFNPKNDHFLNGYNRNHKNLGLVYDIIDMKFLKQCVPYFNFEAMNVNFVMNHVLTTNILTDKETIHLLCKHINTITCIANQHRNMNGDCKTNIFDKLAKFEAYHCEDERAKKHINDASYAYFAGNRKDLNMHCDEYHLMKSIQLISNVYKNMNDVIFDIEYDEKKDHRITLNSILHKLYGDEKEEIYDDDESDTKYPSIFALFGLQNERFLRMMDGNGNANNRLKINDMKPSTFRFLREFFYGKLDIKITAYNALDLYCVCIKYGINAIRRCCLELFANINLYNLSSDNLLSLLLAIDSFSSPEAIPLISIIFDKCPRFALKRQFSFEHSKQLLVHPLLFKLSLHGFEDFIFVTNKFCGINDEDLFIACMRFAKIKYADSENDAQILKVILETLIGNGKYFEFGDHLVIDVLVKMIETSTYKLDDYNESKMITKIYTKSVEKYQGIVEKQRLAEYQQKLAENRKKIDTKLEKEWLECKFVIYDEKCVNVNVNENVMSCTKNQMIKAAYLLCLSDRGYNKGIHTLKYKINLCDNYLAVGISTICNKMVKKGYGLYHLLGKLQEEEGELLGGTFICIWSDGTLLKYINGKNIINQQLGNINKWRNDDIITIIFDLCVRNQWFIQFNRNERIMGTKVKLDENLTYYPIVQLHTRSNHNIQLIEEKHA